MLNIEPIADTIPNASKRLGVSKATVYREMQRGALVAIKARGRTLIPRFEQDRWLASLPVAEPCCVRD